MPATSSRSPGSRTRRPATRCAPNNSPVILERMDLPRAGHRQSVEPKTKADQEKMGLALNRLAPKIRRSACRPTKSGQTIIKGMGELHLDIIVDRMKREFKVEANVGAPQVAYRERSPRKAENRLHPQEAVRRFGPVRPRRSSSSRPSRQGLRVRIEVVGGNVPKEYIPGVEKGVESPSWAGPLIGFPVVDVKVTLSMGLPRRRLVGARVRNRGAAGFREGARRARSCSSRS
jgi:elongation factor G